MQAEKKPQTINSALEEGANIKVALMKMKSNY